MTDQTSNILGLVPSQTRQLINGEGDNDQNNPVSAHQPSYQEGREVSPQELPPAATPSTPSRSTVQVTASTAENPEPGQAESAAVPSNQMVSTLPDQQIIYIKKA